MACTYAARLQDGIVGRRVAFSPDLGHATVDNEVADLVRHPAETLAARAGLPCTKSLPDGVPLARSWLGVFGLRTCPGSKDSCPTTPMAWFPAWSHAFGRQHIAAMHSFFEE